MCHARSRLVWPRERRASLASLPVCRMPMTATLEPIPPWGLSQSRLITVPCSSILVPRTTSSSRAAHALSVAARLTSPRSETTKLTTPGPILQLLQPQNRCNDNMLRIDASSCSPEPELIDSPAHRIRVFASSEPADLSGSNIPAHQEEASSAPPARSQDAQHNLPPPAACWRFQEHGAREHIQCTIKAHLGKRSTLRRASTGGDDLSPLRCAPFGGEGRSQSMKHLEAWSKLQVNPAKPIFLSESGNGSYYCIVGLGSAQKMLRSGQARRIWPGKLLLDCG
ncbi:hypothetical protein T484DRAFT_2080879 [Baffinella frigidus]|nr:hypothetical protein T484DRAFT_2080879 [Cryptophyta sp. CCMP2293]